MPSSSFEHALYVVSTPIGNLEDMSIRGINVLKSVGAIVCEDKRHSAPMLRHFGVDNRLLSYHDHSTEKDLQAILALLEGGASVALISDAGTPLLADPGYKLINCVLAHGFEVIPVPGASALLAALTVAGIATDRFIFEGFLSAKQEARRKALAALKEEPRTMVFYESPHRILDCLQAMGENFGSDRKIALARELTKRFETKLRGDIASVTARVRDDADQRKGEFVIVVQGFQQEAQGNELDAESRRILEVLLSELPVKQASTIAAKITGLKKNALYKKALQLAETN